MKRSIALLVLLSFVMPVPVHAAASEPGKLDLKYQDPGQTKQNQGAFDMEFVPVERSLIDKQKQDEELLKNPDKKKTKWWWWALGIVAVGAVAAKSGGGGGGGGGVVPSSGGGTGTGTVSW